jgi:branched-chain amino acid transport system permease protein
MIRLVQTICDGLILGGILSLSAVGFSLIFGVLNVVNLAHGMLVILGAYLALVFAAMLHIDPLLCLPIVFLLVAMLGYAAQRTVIATVIRRGALMSSLLITFGASLVLQNLVVLTLSPDIRTLSSQWLLPTLHLGALVLDGARATGLIASLLLLALLWMLLNRSRFGKAMQATAQQELAAGLCGIDTGRVYALTFALSAGLAGASGVIVGLVTPFSPGDEAIWTLNAFVVVVLGGVGSPLGALLGGLCLGLVNTLSSQYIGSGFPNIFMFGILLLMLFVRPSGMLGNAFRASI